MHSVSSASSWNASISPPCDLSIPIQQQGCGTIGTIGAGLGIISVITACVLGRRILNRAKSIGGAYSSFRPRQEPFQRQPATRREDPVQLAAVQPGLAEAGVQAMVAPVIEETSLALPESIIREPDGDEFAFVRKEQPGVGTKAGIVVDELSDIPTETVMKYVLVELPNGHYQLRIVDKENLHLHVLLYKGRGVTHKEGIVGGGRLLYSAKDRKLMINGDSDNFKTGADKVVFSSTAVNFYAVGEAQYQGLDVAKVIIEDLFSVSVGDLGSSELAEHVLEADTRETVAPVAAAEPQPVDEYAWLEEVGGKVVTSVEDLPTDKYDPTKYVLISIEGGDPVFITIPEMRQHYEAVPKYRDVSMIVAGYCYYDEGQGKVVFDCDSGSFKIEVANRFSGSGEPVLKIRVLTRDYRIRPAREFGLDVAAQILARILGVEVEGVKSCE